MRVYFDQAGFDQDDWKILADVTRPGDESEEK
jgi:hypothetical protein